MAIIILDRAKETTSTTGTGTLTLSGAVSGFQSLAGVGDGNSTYYAIESGTDWETGIGTYTASGTTLSRDTVYASSASGAKISVASGATVWSDYPADRAITASHGHFDTNFSGAYIDGIVLDYDSTGGNGRISVGASDGIAFYNGGVAGSELGHVTAGGDWSLTRFLDVGNGTLIGGATNPLIAAAGSTNGYVQNYIHNDLAGTSASSDFAAYPDNGTDASGWIDMGITSSVYSDVAYPITGANEGYIFMSAPSGASKTGNLVYATDSTGTENAHQWYSGGFNAAKNSWEMKLNSTNLTVAVPLVSTVTTGTAPFTVASTTNVANLNASSLNGATFASPSAIGGTTPAAITGTTITANTGFVGAHNGTVGATTPSTGAFTGLTVSAGTASVAPIQLTTGTNLTTAAAGAIEYDGASFYASKAASTRGVLLTEQMVVLNTPYTLTSQTAAQKLFNASTNGAITLPIGTYQFECIFSLSAMSATSGSFGFAMVAGGGAVIGSQAWNSLAQKGTATIATATALQATYSTAANTTIATASTNTVGYARIKGIIKITTAGTVTPSVSLGVAAAAVVGANSYFKIAPVTGASAANITVGNWS